MDPRLPVHWRAGCGESRKPGSEGGGWKRTVLGRHLAGHLPYLTYDHNAKCWRALRGAPTLLTRYCGSPDKLRDAVADILADKEVVVPCMVNDKKEDVEQRRAKVQRLKASLKLKDYDARRDFVGWDDDDR